MVLVKSWILKVFLAMSLCLVLSVHGINGDDTISQAVTGDTPSEVKDDTTPAAKETTTPEVAETTTAEVKETTTPEVIDSTTLEVSDTTATEVTDTTTPKVTDTTAPEVTDTTTTPEVSDTSPPEVTDNPAPELTGNTTEPFGKEENTTMALNGTTVTMALNSTTVKPKDGKVTYTCPQDVHDSCTEQECVCLREENNSTASESVPCQDLRYYDEVKCKSVLLKCVLDNGCSAEIRPYVPKPKPTHRPKKNRTR